ncbi:hypothetical protein B9Q03_08250 [Candidatus Marsarchaeota G2 archaeon OSP_D]|uniref:Uncharacterized protein n=5 Tax=Candidatus Marsarchaeota group 2 TaxID=2203771 RepID=A0A2R6CCI9_9ARCH|nr:MAG: hypothetical protein B9Q03_08250 [Candidatus Marsarchaeota G2 archaeon OSP_D]PSN93365.1 MAG: hypothetical protein B9Q06_12190 [Candidatus Marsarchaeota G2 archaeon ECH_B_2]PSN97567.1 MAG: hypothetical protein B9Q07_11860 [Candidatus Marsarchaeota G2 archaeon ECH_B_3]PSN99155.1 MAG: hypothetical protein B9Q05_12070 [Candidatus Marsarchaeota G2 archaeon ECH_B_1]PSO08593.1 MAG: hypothetical protein B9Q04_04735 [Candidatus Marsarchaeota G2 archaeon BE_D]
MRLSVVVGSTRRIGASHGAHHPRDVPTSFRDSSVLRGDKKRSYLGARGCGGCPLYAFGLSHPPAHV